MPGQNFTVMVAGMAQAGMEDYVKEHLKQMMQHSQQEEGCIIYNVHQSTENKREFMMYSVWVDQAAFESHNKTPAMEEFRHKLAKAMFDAQSPKTYWTVIE